MLWDLWRFLQAVVTHWQLLVTGGLVTASVSVIEHKVGRAIGWHVYRWVLAMFVAVSVFLTWRDLDHRVSQQQSTIQELGRQLAQRPNAQPPIVVANIGEENRLRVENA